MQVQKAAQVNPTMRALIDNIERLGAEWGIKPYLVLAQAGLAPGLWSQWGQGQAARTDILQRLSEGIGLPVHELLRPGAVAERGAIPNPFVAARAAAAAHLEEALSSRRSSTRSRRSRYPDSFTPGWRNAAGQTLPDAA